MLTRRLGRSDLSITSIGLGAWAIGGHMWGGQSDDASVDAIHAALDHGVNWIDTAPIYGSGHSEMIVGRAIKALRPSRRPMIFTKFGLGQNSDLIANSGRAEHVVEECEASLRRLDVEKIDLYQLHWPAPQPIAETAEACAKLLAAGKIRAIGVSNFSVAQLDEWQATGVPLHCDQAPFSVLRPAAGTTILPWCAQHEVGAIAYSPLLRGMLFGTWAANKTFPPTDGRSTHKDYSGPRFVRHLKAVDEIQALARAAGLSCAQLCVGVLLENPGLTGCIVGARDAGQGALIAGLGVTVTASQVRAVWDVVTRLQKDLETIN
jgi:aryl-alcohol dehydrogenase-like predicted oxidoreductase